jgi:hypothetical protein
METTMKFCGLPWADRKRWAAANQSIAHLLARHGRVLATAAETARAVRSRLSSLAPLLEALCRRTCLHCPDPCCLGAKIWFDTADLLLLHLSGLPVPEAQPIADLGAVCRYAGPRGCRLGREVRPWICTWYLCPPQAAILRRRPAGERAAFERAVGEIKRLRKVLEEEFIRVTS